MNQRNSAFLVGVLLIASLAYALAVAPPLYYPEGESIHISSGSTVENAAVVLQQRGALHSILAFKIAVLVSGNHGVQAGTYALQSPENVFQLAYRLQFGVTGLQPIRVTIPEGSTSWDIAELLSSAVGDFEVEHFLEMAKEREGYLFPDTYYFLPGTPPDVVIATMEAAYEKNVAPLRVRFAAAGKSEHEILTMASLLQKEARQFETMQLVSGILWARIERGMPLQVDAVFGYIYQRDTFSPLFSDLEVDSPYNTYKYKGLPPGPIANPGIDAIQAALEPTRSPYLFYLTGADGTMHYARTFEEHKANRVFLR